MGDVSQANRGTSAIDHQWRSTVDQNMRTDERNQKVSQTSLQRHTGPGFQQMSLGPGLRTIQSCPAISADIPKSNAGRNVDENRNGENDVFK